MFSTASEVPVPSMAKDESLCGLENVQNELSGRVLKSSDTISDAAATDADTINMHINPNSEIEFHIAFFTIFFTPFPGNFFPNFDGHVFISHPYKYIVSKE
ncbi:Uncharacterised protein [uncultured archaeon]|nr:Uncharacterised protein [uncultured archaeon]